MKVSWKEQGIGGRFKLLFGRKILRRIETRCLDYSDVVTAKSSFTKTLLSQSYSGKLLDKVLVIPGWADLKKFTILPESRHEARAKLGWIEGVPILFTLRRLVHRMGLDNLIAALAKTRALGLNFHFYIGGTGPSLGDLQHQVAHYGLGTQVTFTGRISDEDLPLTFAASNATVLPTSALECFGLPIVESLACNRPALVTPVGALPEIVREFEPRWIAATNSSDGITEIIAKYLRKEIPQELDDPMRAKVAYYSSDRGIQDYLNCFQLAHL
jgi:glycosyltransferase involved in cell wall biosynthesis